jgi:NitT/TauT family transport system ATP-binding protein
VSSVNQIELTNITFGFNDNPLFREFSLCAGGDAENPLVLLGSSGCGKTTLLRIISGLLKPQSGAVIRNAETVSFIFQEPRLLPHLTVLQNVMLPLENCSGNHTPRPGARLFNAEERARHFLTLTGMEPYAKTLPHELSGGQLQRVSIARAFSYPAPLILMDEPFQSLDIPLRIQLMDAVRNLMKAENRFVLAVTHDPREAIYFGKRIIVLGATDGISHIVLDEKPDAQIDDSTGHRDFVSEKTIAIEKRLIAAILQKRYG